MGESSARRVLTTINQELECSIHLTTFSTVLYPTVRQREIGEVFKLSFLNAAQRLLFLDREDASRLGKS